MKFRSNYERSTARSHLIEANKRREANKRSEAIACTSKASPRGARACKVIAVCVSLLLPSTSLAASAAWSRTVLNPDGKVSTWASGSGGDDSLVLTCTGGCTCDNTHATNNIVVYRATDAGAKLTGDYWKADAGVACSDTAAAYCLTVSLPPGKYIFDPAAASAATAECRGTLKP